MSNPDPPPAIGLPSIEDLPDASPTHVLLVSGSPPAELEVLRLNPTAGLAAQFLAVVRDYSAAIQGDLLVEYAAGRTPDPYEVVTLGVDDVPGLPGLIEDCEDPVQAELFLAESPKARALRMYVVSVESRTLGWVHFLRRMTIRSRLQRSGKIAAVFTGAAYSQLEVDPLLFDRSFDAIVTNGQVFVSSQRSFESAMGFLEAARAAALATLNILTANLNIANADALAESIARDLNMVSKLRGIAARLQARPDYAAALTMPAIVDFATSRPDLEIDLEGEAGHEELVFHSDAQRRWRILKLLDDDYLHSELTKLDYEANSKIAQG